MHQLIVEFKLLFNYYRSMQFCTQREKPDIFSSKLTLLKRETQRGISKIVI